MQNLVYSRELRVITTSYCPLETPLKTYYGGTKTQLQSAPLSKVLWHFSTKDWMYSSTEKSRNDRHLGYTYFKPFLIINWRPISQSEFTILGEAVGNLELYRCQILSPHLIQSTVKLHKYLLWAVQWVLIKPCV